MCVCAYLDYIYLLITSLHIYACDYVCLYFGFVFVYVDAGVHRV